MSYEPSPAFSALYEEHFGFIWAVLRRLGVRDADLDDVAQDVFVVVYRRLDDYEARSAIRTWLYGISVRVFWNYARRHRNRPVAAETSASGLPAPVGDGDPESFAARQQASGMLHDLLGKLDPDKRTVFVLSELEGLTAPEIAEVTGANTRTVYSRLRAARSRMEAGLARVKAKERSDVTVRELASRNAAADRPPGGAAQRTWAALLIKLADPATAAVATTGFIGIKTAVVAALVAAGTAGAIYIGVEATRDRAPTGDIVLSSNTPEPKRRKHKAEPLAAADTPRSESAGFELPRANPPTAAPPNQGPDRADIQSPETDRSHSPRGGSGAKGGGEATAARGSAPKAAADKPAPSKEETPVEPASPKPTAEADPVVAEMLLLNRARSALKAGRPAEGLRLLEQHAKQYPKGQLAPERRRTKVTALCAADKKSEAQKLAKKIGLSQPCS